MTVHPQRTDLVHDLLIRFDMFARLTECVLEKNFFALPIFLKILSSNRKPIALTSGSSKNQLTFCRHTISVEWNVLFEEPSVLCE